MKAMFKKLMVLLMAASFLLVMTGCEKEGTAEKAGKKVDQTLDSIKDKIDEVKK